MILKITYISKNYIIIKTLLLILNFNYMSFYEINHITF